MFWILIGSVGIWLAALFGYLIFSRPPTWYDDD